MLPRGHAVFILVSVEEYVPSKGIRSLFLKRTVNSMIIRPICTISDTVGVESRSSGTQ